jgi:ferredoxin
MAKFKIEHDRPNCIGCGACAAVAPEFWSMDADGKSDLKGAKNTKKGDDIVLEEMELDDLKNNMEAAEVCPVNVIHIFEDGKKKI